MLMLILGFADDEGVGGVNETSDAEGIVYRVVSVQAEIM